MRVQALVFRGGEVDLSHHHRVTLNRRESTCPTVENARIQGGRVFWTCVVVAELLQPRASEIADTGLWPPA